MKKGRIIMADPELNYIIRLQIKFLQELREAYEIDVISDREYFEDFFSSPQNADCLIVKEDWVSSSLAKHNIEHVIVLTDGTTGDRKSALVRAAIPRYTSTEEIFNQIRSILGTASEQGKRNEATIIYFGSASGGTGKTVLSVALAEYFSQKYYRVLYVNTQSAQSFQYYLKDRSPIPTDAAMALAEHGEDIYKVLRKQIREERFSYLPPFAMPLFSYGISYDVYTGFIAGARASREFDYIIVDGTSGLTSSVTELLAISDKVVMVVRPEPEYNFALNQFLGKISVKNERLVKICNMVSLNPINDTYDSESVEIHECVSEWRKGLDPDSIHEFSKTDDIQKLAVLIG